MPSQVVARMDVTREKIEALWPRHIRRMVAENTVSALHHRSYHTHCHRNSGNKQGYNIRQPATRWRPSPETKSCFPEQRSLSSTQCLNIASVESKSLILVTQRPPCQGHAWSSPGLPLLLLLLLLMGVVSADQTGTAPLPKHFLETECELTGGEIILLFQCC